MKNKLTFYTFKYTKPQEGSRVILVSDKHVYYGTVINKKLSMIDKVYALLDLYDQVIDFKDDDLWCYEEEFSLQVRFARINLSKEQLITDIKENLEKHQAQSIEIPVSSAELESLDDSLCKELDRLIKLKAHIKDDVKKAKEENFDWNLW